MLENRQFIWDSLLEMKDSYNVAASAKASVDGVAKTFDTGGGFAEGVAVIDITAVAAGTSGKFEICVQGGTSTAFSVYVTLARLVVGKPAGTVGCSATPGIGRYLLPFNNFFGGTLYRYLRIYTFCSGTSAAGITYSAFFSKRK